MHYGFYTGIDLFFPFFVALIALFVHGFGITISPHRIVQIYK